MTVTFCDLRAVCIDHTVPVRGGLLAGYLVRCTSSRAILGHVWRAGQNWKFRAPDQSTGERRHMKDAVATLRALHSEPGTATGRPIPPPHTDADAPRIVPPQVHQRPQARPAPKPDPEPAPVQRIDWEGLPTVPDLTAAIAARLRGNK